MKVTIPISEQTAREWMYFLGKRYGKRLGIKKLMMEAITEIVVEEAKKELERLNEKSNI